MAIILINLAYEEFSKAGSSFFFNLYIYSQEYFFHYQLNVLFKKENSTLYIRAVVTQLGYRQKQSLCNPTKYQMSFSCS